MSYKVSVIIEHDDHGHYAWCPKLPGCQTQGDSLDEVMSNTREAVELYLETLDPEERHAYLSKDILTTSVEIAGA